MEFNNEEIHIRLPNESFDLAGIHDIDPNDVTQTRRLFVTVSDTRLLRLLFYVYITNNISLILYKHTWNWEKHVWDTTYIHYKKFLKDWYKGTGRGLNRVCR